MDYHITREAVMARNLGGHTLQEAANEFNVLLEVLKEHLHDTLRIYNWNSRHGTIRISGRMHNYLTVARSSVLTLDKCIGSWGWGGGGLVALKINVQIHMGGTREQFNAHIAATALAENALIYQGGGLVEF
ncbi:hypothetical protein Tco_1325113 [Tanacetum coccineum]